MSAALALHQPLTPYLGLRYFTEADSDLFFGRDEQVDELLAKLNGSRFVTVIGSSGSGKSSLIGAGLIPALRAGYLAAAGSSWRIARATPGNDPIGNLASRIGEVLQVDGAGTTLRRGPLGLVETMERARLPRGENLLVIADKFEELFRYLKASAGTGGWQQARDEAAAFVKLLLEAPAQRDLPIYVLLAMRSDFLGECSQFRNLPERINDGLYLIPRMRRDQLEQAITGPVQVAGEGIAPRLVERVLNDIGEDQDQLPVLQHALFRTWKQRQSGVPLDLAHYQQVGGLSDALGGHADEIHGKLTKRQQQLAETIFRRLTEVDEAREVRRPATLQELAAVTGAEVAELIPVIDAFRAADVCFLTQTGDLVDITHESLIRQWEQLRGWARAEAADRKDYERFADAASTDLEKKQWLRGGVLTRAEEWSKKRLTTAWARPYRGDYGQTMRFIERSVRARQGERALRLIVLAGVIAGAIAFFWWRSKEEAAQRLHEQKTTQEKLEYQEQATRAVNESILVTKSLNSELVSVNTKLEKTLDLERRAKADLEQQRMHGTWQSIALAATKDFSHRGDDDRGALLAVQALRFHDRKTAGDAKYLIEEPLQAYVSTAEFAHVLTGNRDSVTAVAVSPDGNIAASACVDGRVRIWDLRSPEGSGTVVSRLMGAARTVAFSPDGQSLAWGTDAGYTWLQKLRPLSSRAVALTGQKEITSVAFSPDGLRLASASVDTTVRVYDLGTLSASGANFRELKHNNKVWTVSFSADGKRLATGSEDGSIRLWNLDRPDDPPQVLIASGLSVSSVALSAGGQRLLYWTAGDVGVRDLDAPILSPPVSGLSALTLAVSLDGKKLAVASRDSRIYFRGTWDRDFQRLNGHQSAATSVTFSRDGKRLISGSDDKTVRVWELDNPETALRILTDRPGLLGPLALSPDGKQLAKVGVDGMIVLWDRRQPESSPRVLPASQGTICTAFAPDGTHLASAGQDGTLKIWDLRTNPPLVEVFSKKTGAANSLAFSSDGRHVLTGGRDEAAYVWDIRALDQAPQRFYSDAQSAIKAVAFAPDGHRFAIARENLMVHVFDAQKPNAIRLSLTGQRSAPYSVAFSPDGKSLAAAAGKDKTVLIWDLAKPDTPRILSGHGDVVWSVAYAPDGERIASASDDRTVRLWDLRQPNPEPLRVALAAEGIRSVAFSPDGRSLASGSGAGVVRMHPLWTSAAEEICGRVWRNLSMEEWKLYVGPDIPYEQTCPNVRPGINAPGGMRSQ